jgi:hypothetical protein
VEDFQEPDKTDMKTKSRISTIQCLFLLITVTFSSYPVHSQNALLNNRLLVTDHIQIVEQDYPERHIQFQGIDNLLNKNPGKSDIVEIILNAFTSDLIQPYSFDDFFKPEFPNNYRLSSEIVPVNGDSLAEKIKSIVFIEEWYFDTVSFSFSKEVKGLIPIRHDRQELDPEAQKLELTALFRQPERLSKKDRRKIKSRLVHVKEIAYEFVLTEPHLLYIKGAEEPVLQELGHAAFKYYNINWNRHASNTIVNSIIDKSFQKDQAVFTVDGTSEYNFDSLPYIIDPYLDKLLEEIMDEYDSGIDPNLMIPSLTELKYDLKRKVYSIIFFEDWYIDPETLYLEKRVNGIAPVLWQRRRAAGGYPLDDPETGYPVYFKSVLFRIPLNI